MGFLKFGLLPRLLLGIVSGIIIGSAGSALNMQDTLFFQGIVRLFVTFTALFSTFLSFLIPLLIISFVAVGMAELGKKANKLFGVTLFLAYASTLLAGFTAYFIGAAFLPSFIQEITGSVDAGMKFEPFFTIEVTPICGVMTALVMSFILGIGMANLKNQSMLGTFRDLQAVIAKTLSKVVIPLIPVHIAGLFCKIAANGELVQTAKIFISLFLMIVILQYAYIFCQFGISSLICGQNQFGRIPNILPAYFTALGTQSSASTIPVGLECAKKNGIRNDIADFCIPLCATIHLAGDTICLVLGSMGIMLAVGMEPTLTLFVPFIFMLGVTMVAAPGVPGGGVMAALGLITSMLGFTEPMQQLIISLHFSQDSFGTATNISGDQALALVVNKLDAPQEDVSVRVIDA